MYIKIKTHPNSKENKVTRKSADSFEIYVRAKPFDGEANEAVLDLLAAFLSVPRSKMRLVKGARSRNKIVELLK